MVLSHLDQSCRKLPGLRERENPGLERAPSPGPFKALKASGSFLTCAAPGCVLRAQGSLLPKDPVVVLGVLDRREVLQRSSSSEGRSGHGRGLCCRGLYLEALGCFEACPVSPRPTPIQ